MKRFDLKQLLLCIATLVSSQFELAGVYPLIPAVFMTGFLSGVNRSLLFLCTMGGLIILAPVTVLVKYGLIVLLSAVLIRGVEWYSGYCSARSGSSSHSRDHRGSWHRMEQYETAGNISNFYPNM